MLHLNYGGLEKQTVTLINELAKQGDLEIDIISVYNISGKSFYDLDSKVKIKYLIPYGPNKKEIKECLNAKRYFKLVKELFKGIKILFLKYNLMKKEISKIKSDYIFSTRIEFSKLIKRTDTINISQEHSYIDNEKYIKKVGKSFNYIDYLVVMTDKAKENYDGWIVNKKTKVVVIPNMIEKNEKYISNCENKKIVSVGRLEDVKDFSLLIGVFSKIVEQHKNDDWNLEIIGSGSLKEELEKKIEFLNLKDNIKLTGNLPIDIVYKSLSESSIFVLSSKSESFSLVICEAMDVGLPVVSFDIDAGPREIITDGLNGYLIENRNSDEMASKILSLMDNSKIRKEMGSNAKRSVDRYYSSSMIKKWLEIIK
jgi:N-acetylglucosaminyldiphosphoundecaprenol N-acetyl-beta-D-mannosaminyltransferase